MWGTQIIIYLRRFRGLFSVQNSSRMNSFGVCRNCGFFFWGGGGGGGHYIIGLFLWVISIHFRTF